MCEFQGSFQETTDLSLFFFLIFTVFQVNFEESCTKHEVSTANYSFAFFALAWPDCWLSHSHQVVVFQCIFRPLCREKTRRCRRQRRRQRWNRRRGVMVVLRCKKMRHLDPKLFRKKHYFCLVKLMKIIKIHQKMSWKASFSTS